MKKIICFLVLLGGLSSSSLWAQYGIGTNRPNESAALEIVSPDKGILIPTITLTNSSTFAPITGTSSTTHNGMLVWNDSTSTTAGLDGPGFYFWQNTATAGVGFWYKVSSTDDGTIPQTGTVTNSTLRWDGEAWVENHGLLSDGTNTTSLTTVLHVGNNVTVTGTLEVTDTSTLATTTINNDLTVIGSSTLATTTLTGVLQDYDGDNGTAGQVLSSTGTSTQWITSYAPASGTTTHTTLRWDGTAWVENHGLLSDGTNTTSLTTALHVGNNATVTGTLEVTENATLTSDLVVVENTTASGTLTAKSTTTLESALVDATGSAGTAGQVLSSTGTGTRWIDNTTASLAMMSNTGAVTPTVTILLLTPSGGGSDMTVTLADATLINVGFEIKIRRNEGYTGTNDSITLDGNAAQTIDGQATRKLDVGYQSITLVNTGSAWVSVD